MCHAHLQKFYRYGDPTAGGSRSDKKNTGRVTVGEDGYLHLRRDGVTKAVHIRVAEKALGKALPAGTVVHHVDEDRANNDPTNLVICNRAYHNLIHKRMRAHAATGHYDWLKCCRCKTYDAPENVSTSKGRAYHPACNRAHAYKYKVAP
jgi:hypothetical protein